jgi:hypothetical protein
MGIANAVKRLFLISCENVADLLSVNMLCHYRIWPQEKIIV